MSNQDLVRRYYHELWNTWNVELAGEIIAPDIRFRGSPGLEVRGVEGFRGYMETVRAAFPDFHNTIEELVSEGDKVSARLTYRGTHCGELFGIARPAGRSLTVAWPSSGSQTAGSQTAGSWEIPWDCCASCSEKHSGWRKHSKSAAVSATHNRDLLHQNIQPANQGSAGILPANLRAASMAALRSSPSKEP